MKDKIGFVAVGQAGGNIGKLFEDRGFPVLYANTSKEDLETLENVKYTYHITGGEGCNKDRDKAKQLVIEDFDNIASEIDSKLNTEIVFILFACGGGTGSGAGPMLMDLLMEERKSVGAVSILPALKESIRSQLNGYECFKELSGIEGSAGIFVLDNEKGSKLELNSQFVDLFVTFIEVPLKHKNIKGNIDKAEIEETLKAHGMSVIVKTKEKTAAGLIKALSENPFAPLEGDKAVKYIAVSQAGEYDVTDIEKTVGIPLDTFQTFNEQETICMVSGLSYPKTRLDTMYQKIRDNQELIVKNLKATTETELHEDFNFLNKLSSSSAKQVKEDKPKSKRDIMSKYFKK